MWRATAVVLAMLAAGCMRSSISGECSGLCERFIMKGEPIPKSLDYCAKPVCLGSQDAGVEGSFKIAEPHIGMDASLQIRTSMLSDGGSWESYRRVLRERRIELNECFEDGRAFDCMGVLVKFQINGDGGTNSVEIVGVEAQIPPHQKKGEACVLERVRSWRFPAGREISITYFVECR